MNAANNGRNERSGRDGKPRALESTFGSRHRTSALVFAGGGALGAYEAGAYEALEAVGGPPVDWLAASSIGAINAAIIAGNPPGRRIERLHQFWDAAGADPIPTASFWLGPLSSAGPWRRYNNRASVLQTHLFGRPGIFRPRLPTLTRADDVPGLYDLAPLRYRLLRLVDFDLLNSGMIRLSVVTTDIVTGQRVVFDTRHGARIGPEHLLASSALMPIFAPIEVEGRMLGDGGLSANTPLAVILDEPADQELVCFVVELFAREGSRPRTLFAAAARALDLIFGNQTRQVLDGHRREHELRATIGRIAARLPPELRDNPEIAPLLMEGRPRAATILSLGYRASADEASLAKPFDFSATTLAERWQRGNRDMRAALQTLESLPSDVDAAQLALHEI